jgi:hypothetical protein
MKHITPLILSVTLLGLSARADILELKNGNVLNGKYAGGTTGTVRFETSAGQQVLETPQIIALTFTTPPPAPAPAPAPPPRRRHKFGDLALWHDVARAHDGQRFLAQRSGRELHHQARI